MNIVTTTSVFEPGRPMGVVIDRLADAGFRQLDLAFDYCCDPKHPFAGDGWKDWILSVKEKAASRGVRFSHCHGIGEPGALAGNELAYRVIEAAAMLDVQWIVMHPQRIAHPKTPWSDLPWIEWHKRWMRPFVERCGELGVGCAIENLPWPPTNHIESLCAVVDELNLPNFGICWDTGHANINHIRPDILRYAGQRIVTLHVQDNHGTWKDEHLIPFDGTYDWRTFIRVLHEIGYQGDFVLEAHHQSQEADEAGKDVIFRRLIAVSEQILRMDEEEND